MLILLDIAVGNTNAMIAAKAVKDSDNGFVIARWHTTKIQTNQVLDVRKNARE